MPRDVQDVPHHEHGSERPFDIAGMRACHHVLSILVVSGGKTPVVSDGIRLLMNDLRSTLQLSQADILAFIDRKDSPASTATTEPSHRLSMSDYVMAGNSQRDRESAAGFKNWFDDDTLNTGSDVDGGEAKSILDDISELDESVAQRCDHSIICDREQTCMMPCSHPSVIFSF